MYVTKDGQTILIDDSTLPYWRDLGWVVDDTPEDPSDDAGGTSSSVGLPMPTEASLVQVTVGNTVDDPAGTSLHFTGSAGSFIGSTPDPGYSVADTAIGTPVGKWRMIVLDITFTSTAPPRVVFAGDGVFAGGHIPVIQTGVDTWKTVGHVFDAVPDDWATGPGGTGRLSFQVLGADLAGLSGTLSLCTV